jgi:hypothetical protein
MPIVVDRSRATGVLYIAEGPSLADPAITVKYAVRKEDLFGYVQRRQSVMLAQFALLVGNGLILSRHCFKGLQRELFYDGRQGGQNGKYALVQSARYDAIWNDFLKSPQQTAAPPSRVFVVLISENTHRREFPDIEGWIDRWSWVEEDNGTLQGTPVGWVDRYESKVWTQTFSS